MKKIITALLLSSICTLSLTKELITADNKVIQMRVSQVLSSTSPKGMGALKFKELMEKRFPGRVKVELFPDGKLYNAKNEAEALELGLVDFIIPTNSQIGKEYNVLELNIFDIPFLFNNNEEVFKYINSESGKKLLSMVGKKNNNVETIAFWPNSFKSFSGPIEFKSPNDFKPYSFRVESKSIALYYEALGAKKTVVLPFSEVAKALRKEGEFKLDGADNPLSNFVGGKLYESQKVVTLSRHTFLNYLMVTNKRWLNNLPNDIKDGVITAAKESGQYNFELATLADQKSLEIIKAKGVEVYTWTPEEKKKFKTVAIKIHEQFMRDINKEFLLESYRSIR